MELIALAIAPGIAICLFIFHRDAYNREPKRNLMMSFVLGAAIVLPIAYTEVYLTQFTDESITGVAILAFVVVALTEELGKFLILRLYAFPRKSFDEPLDGIVYAVVIGMGFATLENVLYVQKYGMQTALLRMFLSVPAHATFGVLMGYHAGNAKFDTRNRTRLLLTGLGWAVLFHGLYDFFLFLQGNLYIRDYISDMLLFLGAVAAFILAVRLSFKHIQKHRILSQQTFHPTESLSLRKANPSDIPLIQEMAQKIWPVTYGPILSAEQIDYMLKLFYGETVLQEQMQQNIEFVIVYDRDQPIGFASFSTSDQLTYKLHKIYVLSSQQGRGTGRYIIDQLSTAMRAKGGTHLQLNVNRQNAAKNFYEKLGFTILRVEDIDIGNGYWMNDYVMEKKINEH